MKAFIAGATGYTGIQVVKQWAALYGADAIAHIRPDSSSLDRRTLDFSAASASVDTSEWTESAMKATLARLDVDVVFALLGTTRSRRKAAQKAGREETYTTIDFGLTVLLASAFEAVNPSGRIVYLSSMGASPGGAYLAARWKVEKHLEASSLSYSIARPSFVTGPDREEPRPMEHLGATVVDGVLGALGAIGGRKIADSYRSIDSAHLATALINLAHGQGSQICLADELQRLALEPVTRATT